MGDVDVGRIEELEQQFEEEIDNQPLHIRHDNGKWLCGLGENLPVSVTGSSACHPFYVVGTSFCANCGAPFCKECKRIADLVWGPE